jgi:hypothetical protein
MAGRLDERMSEIESKLNSQQRLPVGHWHLKLWGPRLFFSRLMVQDVALSDELSESSHEYEILQGVIRRSVFGKKR